MVGTARIGYVYLYNHRLRATKDTIEKLKTKNAHCKHLLDDYVSEYMQLQSQLVDAKRNSQPPEGKDPAKSKIT